MPNVLRPDGMWHLRNPKARRSGVVGVLGFEFGWTHADFELGGVTFTNVAVRAKGNIRSLYEPNRAYKVDLNRFAIGQKLGGLDELPFNSLVWDYSCLGAALGYEFFREAGVPAPRTAYAWLSASVTTQWERKPLGLYLMVEAVDNEFAAERFGSKATPVFKPVTYNLFEHLGGEWSAYAPIYDLKTKATPEQQRRVIDFAQLVSSATDAEFAARVGDFLARLFVADRLHRRIDEITAVIRDPIAAQSAFRLDKFEQEVGLKPVHPSPGESPNTFNRPAHEIKRFIDKRAESVRRQLDGK